MQIPTSVDRSKYRGSRAVLASVTCRTDPTRLSFPATEDAQSAFSSTTEFASAIFSPMEEMGLVLEFIYRHRRESGVGSCRKAEAFRWTGEGEAVVSFVDPELGEAP